MGSGYVVGKSEAGNHFCLTSGSPVDSLVVTSNTLENVSDKILRFPESVAPLCVCGASGLGSDDFVERLALFLQGRNFLASTDQQVAMKGELGFVANRAVARDFRWIRLGGADHAIDAAAR